MSRESVQLILSVVVIILVVGLGIYLQKVDAPMYGIPGLLESVIKNWSIKLQTHFIRFSWLMKWVFLLQLTYTVLSFSELKLSQEELQNLIDPAAPLQLINEGEDSAYVVY